MPYQYGFKKNMYSLSVSRRLLLNYRGNLIKYIKVSCLDKGIALYTELSCYISLVINTINVSVIFILLIHLHSCSIDMHYL